MHTEPGTACAVLPPDGRRGVRLNFPPQHRASADGVELGAQPFKLAGGSLDAVELAEMTRRKHWGLTSGIRRIAPVETINKPLKSVARHLNPLSEFGEALKAWSGRDARIRCGLLVAERRLRIVHNSLSYVERCGRLAGMTGVGGACQPTDAHTLPNRSMAGRDVYA